MKNIRKVILTFLTLILVLNLSACHSSSNNAKRNVNTFITELRDAKSVEYVSQVYRKYLYTGDDKRTIREEMEILRKNENGRTSDDVQQVMTKEELEEAQRETAQIFMHERILEYLVQLAQATREHEMLELGMSPRGTVALAKMAKAGAYLAGREYVVPADVRGVFRETAQHRILLNTRARISKVKQKEVLQEILSAVESPSLKKR